MSTNETKQPKRIWRIGGSLAGLIALLAILIAANIILGSLRIRKDITEDRIYTLSKGSRDILKKLDTTVTLKFFFSSSSAETPEFLKSYAQQLEDLLGEYKLAGKGRIVVEKYDPKPDSDAEELAEHFGIQGQSVNMAGAQIYIGLAAVCGENEAAIPVLDPRTDRLLEYNVTRMIYRVSNPKKPVLGIISSLPVMGRNPMPFMMQGQAQPQASPPWIAFRDLGQDYDVREIEPSADEIPPEVDELLVVHPKDPSKKTLYAIDQFVLRGGRLLVFVDPMCAYNMQNAGSAQSFGMPPRASSDLRDLFQAWGIQYDTTKVVADIGATTRVRGRNDQPEESPVYLTLRNANFATNDLITAQNDSMLMAFAGAFSGDGAPGLTVTPLLSTSDRSDLVDTFAAQGGAEALGRQFKSGMKPLRLAVRLHGKFKTAFPEGKPKDQPEDGAPTNAIPQAAGESGGLKESARDTTVILVGDVDMLYDMFWARSIPAFGTTVYEPFNDNISFFGNAVEQLAGSSDFVNVRCRGKSTRPFTRVLELQRAAQEHWMAQETSLQQKLEATQQRLSEMQIKKEDNQRFILSPDQKKEIDAFKKLIQDTQRELKLVRKNLREGIESLGTVVKVINILLAPALVCMAGVGFWFYRRSKTKE